MERWPSQVEGARLLSECGVKMPHRGFESLSLRHYRDPHEIVRLGLMRP